jgi:hypothetical protein
MNAVVLHEYGGPEKLKFEDNVPEPQISGSTVLIPDVGDAIDGAAAQKGLAGIVPDQASGASREFPNFLRVVTNDVHAEKCNDRRAKHGVVAGEDEKFLSVGKGQNGFAMNPTLACAGSGIVGSRTDENV